MEQLPIDIINEIIEYLKISEVVILTQVSSKFRRLSEYPNFYSKVFNKRFIQEEIDLKSEIPPNNDNETFYRKFSIFLCRFSQVFKDKSYIEFSLAPDNDKRESYGLEINKILDRFKIGVPHQSPPYYISGIISRSANQKYLCSAQLKFEDYVYEFIYFDMNEEMLVIFLIALNRFSKNQLLTNIFRDKYRYLLQDVINELKS